MDWEREKEKEIEKYGKAERERGERFGASRSL